MRISPCTIQTGNALKIIRSRKKKPQIVHTSGVNSVLEMMMSVAVVLPTITSTPGCIATMRVFRLPIRSLSPRTRRTATTRWSPTRASPAYLIKYAAKVEPHGKVSNPLGTVDEVQPPRAGPEQDGVQSVHQKQLPHVWGRKIALSEATLTLSGQAMCLKSRIYKLLNAKLPHLRRVVVQQGEEGVAGNGQGGGRRRND